LVTANGLPQRLTDRYPTSARNGQS
jgi:hypothetical protein